MFPFFTTEVASSGHAFLLRGCEVVGFGSLYNQGVYQKSAMPQVAQGRESRAEAPVLPFPSDSLPPPSSDSVFVTLSRSSQRLKMGNRVNPWAVRGI